ncbi:MAG: hypothetical protein Unbinned4388contig1000_83 [Prokaryotic dsDNA virus sp.]|nr:MAG: hypothetical protein Unbinned4388contig1000_83 [Prokaryotic dsDNA virus sp.]|tara:strand:+ start:11675 stop:12055 length:381 start_codon:yes stop_codon:yes gene_type:complete
MAIRYFKNNDAEIISKELYELSRPPQVREASDVSAYMFGWVENDLNEVVLLFDDEATMPIHQQADVQPLIDVMSHVPEAEKTALAAYITSKISDRIDMVNLIPSTAVELTEAQMYEQGFYNVEEEI